MLSACRLAMVSLCAEHLASRPQVLCTLDSIAPVQEYPRVCRHLSVLFFFCTSLKISVPDLQGSCSAVGYSQALIPEKWSMQAPAQPMTTIHRGKCSGHGCTAQRLSDGYTPATEQPHFKCDTCMQLGEVCAVENRRTLGWGTIQSPSKMDRNPVPGVHNARREVLHRETCLNTPLLHIPVP